MSETKSDPFQESGSGYVPSDLDQPSTSRALDERSTKTKKKRVRRSFDGSTLREKRGKNE